MTWRMNQVMVVVFLYYRTDIFVKTINFPSFLYGSVHAYRRYMFNTQEKFQENWKMYETAIFYYRIFTVNFMGV